MSFANSKKKWIQWKGGSSPNKQFFWFVLFKQNPIVKLLFKKGNLSIKRRISKHIEQIWLLWQLLQSSTYVENFYINTKYQNIKSPKYSPYSWYSPSSPISAFQLNLFFPLFLISTIWHTKYWGDLGQICNSDEHWLKWIYSQVV